MVAVVFVVWWWGSRATAAAAAAVAPRVKGAVPTDKVDGASKMEA